MDILLILVTVLIPVLFVLNLGVYWLARKKISVLEQTVYPKGNRRDNIPAELALSDKDCERLRDSTCKASMAYSFFANTTAVFPLLGILGTVVSLMNLSGTDDLSANFSSALLTTFLGLVAAIIFKLMDAGLAPRLERALDESDYLIHQHDKERRSTQCVENEI